MTQKVIETQSDYTILEQYIKEKQIRKIFLVCGNSSYKLPAGTFFSSLESMQGVELCRFGEFQPNPLYESVKVGTQAFLDSKADCIVAIGGGSAMDVAKCIKAFAALDQKIDYLQQTITGNEISFVAIPTTAGTGSEATHFAVIYRNGEKLSIAHKSMLPDVIVLDSDNLTTLPRYQRQATMMDALCHAIEACWSVNAVPESDEYAKKAIRLAIQYKDAYLSNKEDGNEMMLRAAYYAGKAINITKTTAAHAMSYKLTSVYGIAHGHAAAVCLSEVWEQLLSHCGQMNINESLQKIVSAMGCDNGIQALQLFRNILEENHLNMHECIENEKLEQLTDSVNVERLNNHPVTLSRGELKELYRRILS